MLINLASDTSTLPSAAMRAAMAGAKTGDEQRFEDPSTRALCEQTAELLGQEDAVFLPSGTMCNLISAALHCAPGDEIICAESAHIYGSEGAGYAWLAGASINPIPTATGIFSAAEMAEKIRRPKLRAPRSAMVVIEQTANRSGGTIWPVETIKDVSETARSKGLAVHMDGARVLNAAVATGIPARDYGEQCDSIWLDFTKGLGCPLGAVLAGSRDFIERAWLWKHRLGGAMRQSGLSAAACSYALDNNVKRLTEDHANASRLAKGLRTVPGLVIQETVETNIVMIDLPESIGAEGLNQCLATKNIRLSIEGEHRMRAVTHLNISKEDVDAAVAGIAEAVQNSENPARS